MSTDFNKPVAADLESVILAQIRAGRDDQARMFEPTLTGAHSNLKIGTIRWNDSTKRDEIWDGSTWGPKATLYSISINGNAATATKWATPRLLTIGETGKNVDGSAAVSWTLEEIGAEPARTLVSQAIAEAGAETIIKSWTAQRVRQAITGWWASLGDLAKNISGNAATATKWAVARTLTLGATGKAVDGSANVTWTAEEMGVVPDSGTSTVAGAKTFTSDITVQNSSPEVVLVDTTDSGSASVKNDGNYVGFYDNDAGQWQFRTNDAGRLHSLQYGWLDDYFALAGDSVIYDGSVVESARIDMSGPNGGGGNTGSAQTIDAGSNRVVVGLRKSIISVEKGYYYGVYLRSRTIKVS
jgi:hypothetical protein